MNSGNVSSFEIRKIEASDKAWVTAFMIEHWGSSLIITRGKFHNGENLPGFIAVSDSQNVGLITYDIELGDCEIVSLNSIVENRGIATALIDAVKHAAANCWRIWLITTNDNLHAIEFYKKRGFSLKAIYRDAIAETRKLKPSIPELGFNDLPIKDEIEFEYLLN